MVELELRVGHIPRNPRLFNAFLLPQPEAARMRTIFIAAILSGIPRAPADDSAHGLHRGLTLRC